MSDVTDATPEDWEEFWREEEDDSDVPAVDGVS